MQTPTFARSRAEVTLLGWAAFAAPVLASLTFGKYFWHIVHEMKTPYGSSTPDPAVWPLIVTFLICGLVELGFLSDMLARARISGGQRIGWVLAMIFALHVLVLPFYWAFVVRAEGQQSTTNNNAESVAQSTSP